MEITIQVRNVFGTNRAYPRDKNALTFCKIAGTETLTAATLRHAQELGFKIRVEPVRLGEVA